MMYRRVFFRTAAGVLLPIPVKARQGGKVARVGYLGLSSVGTNQDLLRAFREELRQHGWVEGRNIVIDIRYAEGNANRLPELVGELIRLDVDVIVTSSSATTRAAKDATQSIPIIMASSADALGRS